MRLLLILVGISAYAQTSVTVVGVTPTQAVLSYTCSSSSAATVEVSESNTYSPLVHDVDGTLFTGAASDGSSVVGVRQFVVGKRITALALDSNNYSRSLQAFTTHYYRISACGAGSPATGQFTTANLLMSDTYQDVPQVSGPASVIMPTLLNTPAPSDRNQVIVDPHTGVLIQRLSLPADSASDGGGATGPYMNSGGFVKACTDHLLTPGGGVPPGALCSFPQGNGGYGEVYYIIPSPFEVRYLGRTSWTGFPYINPTDGKWYDVRTPGPTASTDIIQYAYTGTYAAVSSGTVITFTPTTILANYSTALVAFDATFTPANYTNGDGTLCSLGPTGDYITVTCFRHNQDSYGYAGIVQISTNSLVAFFRVDTNILCRWCSIHNLQAAGYTEPVILIGMERLAGNALGQGPYATSYTGGTTVPISGSNQTIAVAGNPTCGSPCTPDSDIAPPRVGDKFYWSDSGEGGEHTSIVTVNSPTSWTIGPVTSTHAPGTTLVMACDFNVVYWKFLLDPHGTDSTNTFMIKNATWPAGGHDDAILGTNAAVASRLTESTGWVWRTGDLITNIALGPNVSVTSNQTFAGATGRCFGDGCKRHPSEGPKDIPWASDYQGWDGDPFPGQVTSNISGQLYKFNTSVVPLAPRYMATIASTDYPAAPPGGPHVLQDVSGPGVTLGTGSGDNYKFCIVNAVNECTSGSAVGESYFNVPGTVSTCFVNGWDFGLSATLPCLANYNWGAGSVVQIGQNGKFRNITGGLVGVRDTNDYPSAKTLPDGSGLIFTYHDVNQHTPAQLMVAKLPPFSVPDSVDRTKFIDIPITLTNPGGVGATTADIKFGYIEQGTVTQYFCTSRREICASILTGAPPTDGTTHPFVYTTTDLPTGNNSWSGAGVSCATTCTVHLPVLPGHIVYYQAEFRNAGNTVVATGTPGISGDFVSQSSVGLFPLPMPIQ
jgi:hypothetical protein